MSVQQVFDGERRWACVQADAVEFLRSLPDDSVDLLFTSPPYLEARTYGIGAGRKLEPWVSWMVELVTAASPKVKGLIAVNCEGQTRNYRYLPSPFLLAADLHRAGFNLRKPCVYERDGIPGSGGPDWLKNRWEPIICVTRPGRLPWSDNTACGKPPKFGPGGEFSYRGKTGGRANYRVDKRIADQGRTGEEVQPYQPPDLANPGNVIDCGADTHFGFGNESEAPFPLKLAEFFVRSFCPPRVCLSCGTAVQYSHENKTMQAVQGSVPSRQPSGPILLGGLSANGIQDRRAEAVLPDVPEGVHDVRISCGSEKILFEDVCEPWPDQATPAVQGVRGADTRGEGHAEQQVLFETVRESLDGEAPAHDQEPPYDAGRLHPPSDATAPARHAQGVCDGTPGSDGTSHRKAARKGRGRASQERGEGRQPNRKPGTDAEEGSRLFAQAKTTDRVPEVRSLHRPDEVCTCCGADLARPGTTAGGVVCDPFSGSGTVAEACFTHGRRFVGCDLRQSQVELCGRRLATVTPNMFAEV